MVNRDRFLGIGLLLFCGLLYAEIGQVEMPAYDILGSALFPKVTLVSIAALSAILAIKPGAEAGRDSTKWFKAKNLLFLCLTAAYLGLLSFGLGFLLSSFFFVSLMMILIEWPCGPKFYAKAAVVSGVSSVSVYWVFNNFLQLLLP